MPTKESGMLTREQIEDVRLRYLDSAVVMDSEILPIFDMALSALSRQQGEAVAWRYQPAHSKKWVLIPQELAVDAHSYACGRRAEPLYTTPALSPAQGAGWQPIETAPKDGRTLLLGGMNSNGKWRTMRGEWATQETIDEYWEDPDSSEPGWFESAVESEICWAIAPTHWQPLPLPPKD